MKMASVALSKRAAVLLLAPPQRLLGLPALGEVQAGADDELDRAVGAEDGGVGPGDPASPAVLGAPVVLVLAGELAGRERRDDDLNGLRLLREKDQMSQNSLPSTSARE